MYLDIPCSDESLALLCVLEPLQASSWKQRLASAVCNTFEVELYNDCINAYIYFIGSEIFCVERLPIEST